jgi:hypothetical protein
MLNFLPRCLRKRLLLLLPALAGVLVVSALPASVAAQEDQPVTVVFAPLAAESQPCLGAFVAAALPHFTAVENDTVRMFDANGAGVAAGDLDGDGDLDLLFGNHDGEDSLLWNQGDLRFRLEPFSTGKTRDVKLVDVDADGRLDAVLTRNTGALNYFHNEGEQDGRIAFRRQTLPGVAAPAYSTNWGDLDGDGDLDLVTGTYDAGLLTERGSAFIVNGSNKGVYVYRNEDGRFSPTALAHEAQALAILLPDLNADGRLDIVVGNDFLVPDMIWLQEDDGWAEAEPFAVTTHSTMSLDQGDIDNDGRMELFAADMKPYSEADMIDMMPVMDDMMEGMTRQSVTADRQAMENVLQFPVTAGEYLNLAPDWGVDGTGWSWSSKFGDLDNDGFLDLYSVNGMIEETLFAHMPNHELVEKNQAFRNEGGLRFRSTPGWRLDSTLSGRGMLMADLDGDGDLDIVANNLRGPAQLFENRLCSGRSLQVDLRWPSNANTHAIGAQVTLRTGRGDLLRDVRAGSGYLSGDPPRLHFGLPADTEIEGLEILWPDGAVSSIDDIAAGTLLQVTRE